MDEDELDVIDARINDNIILAEMAETSLSIAQHRGDVMAAAYDEEEMMFWLRAADEWHRHAYDSPLDRKLWHERYGI